MSGAVLGYQAVLVPVSVEAHMGEDGQGLATYGAAVEIQAAVRLKDEFLTTGLGAILRTHCKIWVPEDAETIPGDQDRVTVDGVAYIVEEFKEVKQLSGAERHYRLRARRQ